MAHVFKTFADVLDLTPDGDDVWFANSDTYPWRRVYGGQVAAQGLWAAAQTVEGAYLPHSVHAYFIRGGDPDEPIRFEVDRLRNGRSFVTRRVVAHQSGGAILNLSASFTIPTTSPDTVTIVAPDAPSPASLPADNWGPLLARRSVPAELGVARSWLKVGAPLPDDPLVHLVAHVYASDDMPTEAVELTHPVGRPNRAEPDDQHPYMGATLDHAIWFHRPAPADEWMLHDLRSSGVQGERGLSTGEIWSGEGVHVATIAQEVLLRERRG